MFIYKCKTVMRFQEYLCKKNMRVGVGGMPSKFINLLHNRLNNSHFFNSQNTKNDTLMINT